MVASTAHSPHRAAWGEGLPAATEYGRVSVAQPGSLVGSRTAGDDATDERGSLTWRWFWRLAWYC
jgi:hypothetical protein